MFETISENTGDCRYVKQYSSVRDTSAVSQNRISTRGLNIAVYFIDGNVNLISHGHSYENKPSIVPR